MERTKEKELITWKEKKNRKPLVLSGARQVGKSWLVKHFADKHYNGKIAVINFDLQKEVHIIFEKNLDIKRIVFELELLLNIDLTSEGNLIFFDEIQACPNALASLRYFYEELPHIHLIAAGSLLDFEFRNVPFPVGRVDLMSLFPMSFYEFLLARGKRKLAETLLKPIENSDINYSAYFEEDLNLYMIIGGMPEAVDSFIKNNDLAEVQQIQSTLLYSYEQDFKKYRPTVDGDCLEDILANISKLLGSQVIYSKLSERFSGNTVKKGVEVLKTARILHAVQNVSISGLPLTASGKRFKLFYLDVGLLVKKSGLDYRALYSRKELTAAFQGALTEQFVLQQLVAHHGEEPNYWARTEQGASSEIDFVIQQNSKIIPIEVKSGKTGSLKSLHYLLSNNEHIEKAVVYSNARYGVEGKVHFIPLAFAGMQ